MSALRDELGINNLIDRFGQAHKRGARTERAAWTGTFDSSAGRSNERENPKDNIKMDRRRALQYTEEWKNAHDTDERGHPNRSAISPAVAS
jgi:hypothetical protein